MEKFNEVYKEKAQIKNATLKQVTKFHIQTFFVLDNFL
jgi:hypothetical protein